MAAAAYTFHLPADAAPDDPGVAERAVVVRDAFSWGAFVAPMLWFFAHRHWLAGIGAALAVGLLALLLVVAGFGTGTILLAELLLHGLIGLEAPSIRRWLLARQGRPVVDVVQAGSTEEAEVKGFGRWVAREAAPAAAPALRPATIPAYRASEPVIGLFPDLEGEASVSVAIVDYGSGNLHSAAKAFERAARESGHGQPIVVTADPDAVARADRIVLPGVGAFADCRRGLDAVDGMTDALTEAVRVRGQPFLGICVGMQLMATRGLEKETIEGLGWIPGDVAAIEPDDASLKVPHMGWNTLETRRPHALLDGIDTGAAGLHAYYVHSYALRPGVDDDLVAVSSYGGSVTAIVARDTMAGTQFHPEKSQALGLRLIANFLAWRP